MLSKSIVLLVTLAGFTIGAATLRQPAAPGMPDDPTSDSQYVGAKSCKKCHFPQHKTWKATKHANAWNVLPEKYHDPAQTDDKGRSCIGCHVTGYGQGDRGGFVDTDSSSGLLGVQCEACHGPGSKHADIGKQMLKAKKKHFDPGEPTFITLKTTNCSNCHNPHISHSKYAEEG